MLTDRQKEILKGIIETEHQAHAMISLSHAAPLYVLDITCDEIVARLENYNEGDDQRSVLIPFKTFLWKGTLMNEMHTHMKHIRVGWILDVTEITDDMWYDYLTDQAARGSQQAQARMKQ